MKLRATSNGLNVGPRISRRPGPNTSHEHVWSRIYDITSIFIECVVIAFMKFSSSLVAKHRSERVPPKDKLADV